MEKRERERKEEGDDEGVGGAGILAEGWTLVAILWRSILNIVAAGMIRER